MKIIRYQDKNGNISHAAQQADGSALKLAGDIFHSPQVTAEKADVAKLLAPVVPSSIICIGLNYRRHAEETGAKFPEQPVVFFKGINTLSNPDEPIQIPQFMRSDEVDYECELAVVIGKPCKNV
jgi:2-keto-4-pentenoate hydratase/2-oxohepta-3-ene-1,7-dioic acid hydratase in catechol pathway